MRKNRDKRRKIERGDKKGKKGKAKEKRGKTANKTNIKQYNRIETSLHVTYPWIVLGFQKISIIHNMVSSSGIDTEKKELPIII